jgi:hypothetical protein
MGCGIPHSASVSVHRVKAHEKLHHVFEAYHQRSTSSPQRRSPARTPASRIPFWESTCSCTVFSVQRSTAPHAAPTRSPIPVEHLTLGSSRNATCRHQRIHVHTTTSSLLATYSDHGTQQTQPSIPLRPLRHVTSNGQDGAYSCSISPDSHSAPAVPVRASRTPGPSRQSRRS